MAGVVADGGTGPDAEAELRHTVRANLLYSSAVADLFATRRAHISVRVVSMRDNQYGANQLERLREAAMIITHEREKLVQSIVYFSRHTRKCGKIKLFKLLYFLDFEHFKQTGRSVTGLSYHAWPMGPVPVELYNEIEQPKADLSEAMNFEEKQVRGGEHTMLTMQAKRAFIADNFSRRELGIMRDLALEYRMADADSMIEATHLENLPWNKIYNELGQHQALIPYDLAARADERDLLTKVDADRKELLARLK